MAILKFYNPTVHDIHTYSPAATRVPRVDGQQIGYNPSCQGTSIDWSGVSLRPRAFARALAMPQSQIFLNITYDINNINFWNTENPCAVLISPRHALICEHYRGAGRPVGENETYTFLGKSGTYHTHKVKKVTFSIGPDHTLLEFENRVDVSDVAAYSSIVDMRYTPQGRDMWIQDCQGRAYKIAMGVPYYGGDPQVVSGYGYTPILDGVNNGAGSGVAQYPYIWVGDSGSPTFALDNQGNTMFVGLKNGGEQVNILEIDAINQELSEYGYEITHFNFSSGGGGGPTFCPNPCSANITTFNNPSISSPFKSSLYPDIVETNSEIPSVNLTLQNYKRADSSNRFILSRYSRQSAHTDWYLYYLQSISSTFEKIKKQSENTTRNPIVAVPAIRTHYKKDESQYYPNQYFTP
jgi:hypothetical protein